MFGSIFTIMFIMVAVSIVLGIGRSVRGSGSDQLDQQPRQPQLGWGQPQQFFRPPMGYGQHFGFGQQLGYGQGYDPSAAQPLSPASRDAVNADITTFGEQLRDLDFDVVGRTLDADAQADYGKALDSYDGAKQQLEHARSNADVKRITEILDEGRYAIACVKARSNGAPVPEHRPPCFFDPAHGTSVANVQWAPPGGAMREVPACAADAQRVRTGNDPSIRMVHAGPQLMPVPYWEDPRHAAWAQGYYGRYGSDPVIRQITTGALMIGGFSLLMGLLDD
ncbi:hypothetical protein [Tessaracoccus sp. MC1756]|uniref:hypothetical protein n=1 Tax=Tessaracoccus sp. MC1756 TaxID=2760311 RepID=UPI0015FFCB79|nr:hypothetical protein [Tessaracoccus sp. MC1756]MBB1509399.1 hypothetical protein [Tessaracoccus sp. MC1756]